MTHRRVMIGGIRALVFVSTFTVCGHSSPPGGPTATAAAIELSANPNPIVSRVCTACGAGSTDREAVTQLTIREVNGIAATVTAIAMSLRDTAAGATIAAGEFDESAVASLAGSARLSASGTLTARDVGVHYATAQAGRAATLTYTVRIRDDRGNITARDLAVPVPST